MRVEAFSPGHITGFFLPMRHADPLRSGSRGAGMSISLGARSVVSSSDGTGKIEVLLNGMYSSAPVTMHAAKALLGDRQMDLSIDTELQIPIAQGLGASAAGSLSAALAVAQLVGASRQEAFEAAHRAEIANNTGLGDIAGIYRGGMEFRRKEGLPPYGIVDRFGEELDLVIAVVGPATSTAEFINDEVKMNQVQTAGEECVSVFAERRDVDSFFRISRAFVEKSGIGTPEVRRALRAIDGYGQSSMSMLGNTVFATGDVERMEEALSQLGKTFRCKVDTQGARLVSSSGL
jgi:pantoate kinase